MRVQKNRRKASAGFVLLLITLGNSVKIPFPQRLRLRPLGTAVGKG
ncbi:hypothetical protein CLOLEP_00745 [[Clostridium] leptum DSM 753]|uniref:Uncharacterized protein n=1 Tax=[Clostridium] leptum DSM 753 TaxID=428125 RepID=A7VQB7_9FIRM|nr:hypothetical protein CLOLEP_00745 [[Clostridium] leptum DSM 753]